MGLVWRVVAMATIGACLLWAAQVAAGDGRVPTRTYQLDSGQHVRTWLDEPIGVWCVMVLDNGRAAGVACVPLTGTAYAWPVQPARR